MVESKLSFLLMQIEGTLGQAIELGHTYLCIAPETFDPVDVSFTGGELIGAMVNAKMFVKADIYQPIVTRPAIRMVNRSRVDVAPNNPLQFGLGAVRHNFCVDHTLALEQTKDNRLALGTTPSSTSNSLSTEVGLIHHIRTVQRLSLFTGFSQSLMDLQVDRIHRTKPDTRHFRSRRRSQIYCKTPEKWRNLASLILELRQYLFLVTISGSYFSS